MKYNIDKNNLKRKKNDKKIHNAFQSLFTTNADDGTVKRFKDGGFIAWPEEKSQTRDNKDCEVREGRTKNGGFIAFPK